MSKIFEGFELFTSEPRLKPAYFLPDETEQEHRSRQYRSRRMEREANKGRSITRALRLVPLAAEQHAPYREVRYIATATEDGRWFSFQVLASNARYSQPVGRYLDFQEGKEAVEATYSSVTWVTPYRFQKELTAY